jgi:threonine aldolase
MIPRPALRNEVDPVPMNRRHFLASGTLAAATPLLASAATPADAAAGLAPVTRRVDLMSDGLALSPAEYAAQLQQIASAPDFVPDYYSNGGAIAALEQAFAQRLGKPAAVFLPTGTLANHVAVRTLARGGGRVLVQAESHLYNDSGDGAAALSGLNLVPLAAGRATLDVEDLAPWVERAIGGRVPNPVRVLSIETPVRRLDHAYADWDALQRVSAFARERGLRLHLDGARLFTLPHHTGRGVADYAALFDTVYVSLWKHFNAASGAILAGDADVIEGLFHVRRMFGGSLPFAWPQAALAARYLDGFERDYAAAWAAMEAIASRLRADGRLDLRRLEHGTSRAFLVAREAFPAGFAARLRADDIHIAKPANDTREIPLQVNASLLRRPADALVAALLRALDASPAG